MLVLVSEVVGEVHASDVLVRVPVVKGREEREARDTGQTSFWLGSVVSVLDRYWTISPLWRWFVDGFALLYSN